MRERTVVVLAPSALERCSNSDDWLRKEIERALVMKRNIVPLMVEGFSFETCTGVAALPVSIRELLRYQGLRVPPDFFEEAMHRLRSRFLTKALDAVLRPLTPIATELGRAQTEAALAAPQVQSDELNGETNLRRCLQEIKRETKHLWKGVVELSQFESREIVEEEIRHETYNRVKGALDGLVQLGHLTYKLAPTNTLTDDGPQVWIITLRHATPQLRNVARLLAAEAK